MPTAQLNNHTMYYEVHEPPNGQPAMGTVVCTTGWGTFCHGDVSHLPRGLNDRYRVIIYDHRGIAKSGDDVNSPATMRQRADDLTSLLDHLNSGAVHLVGIAGMGACICQEVAINRPDLARSLVNSGAWCFVDEHMRAQLELWLDVHERMGFAAFQQLVTLTAFDASFYEKNHARLLGDSGGWRELKGRLDAHRRITASCLSHHSLDRLDQIYAPALIIHMGRDTITAPRLTLPIEQGIRDARGVMMADAAHVPTGRAQKKFFDDTLMNFLRETDEAS